MIRILYVDAGRMPLNFTKEFLESQEKDFQVDTTISAKIALNKLSKEEYDVVVSGHRIPDMGGLEFLSELREQNEGIPFILITDRGTVEATVEAYKRGVDGYIVKEDDPISQYAELANQIRQVSKRRKMEKQLQESEEKYRTLVELAHDGIMMAEGPERTIIFANQRMAEMLGYTIEELIGKSYVDLIHPDDKRTYLKERITFFSSGEPATYERLFLRKDGTSIPVLVSVSLIKANERSESVPCICLVTDITQRRKMEEALKQERDKAQSYLDTVGVIVVALDREGRVTLLNRKGCEILECSEQEALGKNWFNDFLSSSVREEAESVFQLLLAGDVEPVEYYESPVLTQTGEERLIVWHNAVLKNSRGDVTVVLRSGTDITEWRQVEKELWQIEWLLHRNIQPNHTTKERKASYRPVYADLSEENKCRILLDSLGKEMLTEIAYDYLDLLETSVTIHEKNGDYALSPLSSCWCRLLDQTSNSLCKTDDNRETLKSRRWHCQECCWKQAAEIAIKTGQPVDTECWGGLNHYSVPIKCEGEILGAITIGYGDPPRDLIELREIAKRYHLSIDKLLEQAESYESRPPFIINYAKNRLQTTARLIGEIAQRRKIEGVLRESENKLRSILEASNEAVLISQEGRYTYANKRACELFKYPRKELIGLPIEKLHLTNRREEMIEHHWETMRGMRREPEIEESVHITKDGTEITTVEKLTAIDWNGKPAELVYHHDITERKKMEEKLQRYSEQLEDIVEERTRELRRSEERYRSLFMDSPVALWEEDFSEVKKYINDLQKSGVEDFRDYFRKHPDSVIHCGHLVKILDVNEEALSLYEARNREELLSGIRMLSYEELPGVFAEELIAIAEGRTMFKGEAITETVTGKRIHVTFRWSIAPGYKETLARVLISVIDITHRRRMEEKLRESEEKYRTLVELAHDGIMMAEGPERTIIFANQRMAEMLGYTIEELIGKSYKSLIHPEEKDDYREKQKIRLASGKASTHERRLIRKDGTFLHTLLSLSIIDPEDKTEFAPTFGIFTEIKEMTNYKEQHAKLREGLNLNML